MLKIDDVIDQKYQLVRLIGEGGMGAVYEGKHLGTGRRVAVKVIRPGPSADGTEVLVQRFQREARAAGAIESQYIAQVLDAGRDTQSGFPYLVLEYLTGEDLQQLIHRLGPLPLDLAMRIFAQTCVGLAKAHAANVVHRDVKPANVFLANRDDGEVICKLLDFGVAKFQSDPAESDSGNDAMDAAGLTQTGALVGSPLFMSPEQARGRRDIDHRADIWALGILLFKMLIGKTPHERSGLGIGELIMSICLQPPPPIRQIAPWIPVEIESLLTAILRLEREARPQNVEMILTELRVLLPMGWSLNKSMLVASGAENSGRISLPPPSLMPANPPLGRLLNSPVGPSVNTAETLENQMGIGVTPEPSVQPTTNPSLSGPAAAVDTLPSATPARSSRNASLLPIGIGAIGLAAIAIGIYARGTNNPSNPESLPVRASAAKAEASVIVPANSASASANRPSRRTDCPTDMVLIAGGKFVMGSDEPLLEMARPTHSVFLDTFCIDKHEVTAGDYRICSEKGECKRPADAPNWSKAAGISDAIHEKRRAAYADLCNFGKTDRDNHPINCVSWFLANDYCAFRQRRLPTEAEWEYVARGADERKSLWGDVVDPTERTNAGGSEFARWETKHALIPSARLYNVDDGFEGTAPVGSFPKGKTKHGVDDFIGNVWEWTWDWFGPYEAEEVINPRGPASSDRKVIRGGSFEGGARQWLNPGFRAGQPPSATSPTIGFRCAMNL